MWHAQDATADGWRILEDYRIFLTSRSQEATAATEAVRNRWRNEARSHPAPQGFRWHRKMRSAATFCPAYPKQIEPSRSFLCSCPAACEFMHAKNGWHLLCD